MLGNEWRFKRGLIIAVVTKPSEVKGWTDKNAEEIDREKKLMPIEKILTRTMAVLALIFLVLTLTYYPPSYAVAPAIFLLVFIIADVLLPAQQRTTEKRWKRIASQGVVGLLIFGALACVTCLALLWKLGPFGKFSNQ